MAGLRLEVMGFGLGESADLLKVRLVGEFGAWYDVQVSVEPGGTNWISRGELATLRGTAQYLEPIGRDAILRWYRVMKIEAPPGLQLDR